MKKPVLIFLLSLFCLQMACNLPGSSGATPTPVVIIVTTTPEPIQVTNTPEPTATASNTPLPLDTPTPEPTATPSTPMVAPTDKPTNCRYGPSVDYISVAALNLGDNAPILGKTSAGSWWQIANPSSPTEKCWVAASVTTTSGDISTVPVVAAPNGVVTSVSVIVAPKKVTVPGCGFPYKTVDFRGTIVTNGPVEVSYYWETSSGDRYKKSIKFSAFGEQYVKMSYPVTKKGDQWVKLVITSPIALVAEAKYSVVCGP